MYDFEPVGILDARDDLLEETACHNLGHAAVLNDIVEQFAAGILEDDDDVGSRRDDLVPAISKE